MFDDVVLLDDRLVAEGKQAGLEDGKARGFKEGEGMGKVKGFGVAAEMGFYRGCCLAWLALNEHDPCEDIIVVISLRAYLIFQRVWIIMNL